ncbi:hypothetical protein EVA_15390 [gut metagenome]|uniref:Uncharacterized protein n=1 Tax=gut metagenome TaxID=749906 RepID=J9FPV7_9ZZZZ
MIRSVSFPFCPLISTHSQVSKVSMMVCWIRWYFL